MCKEKALKDRMCEYLVPRNTVDLPDPEALSQKVNSLVGKVFSFDIERLLLYISHQLNLTVSSPGGFSMKKLIENEA